MHALMLSPSGDAVGIAKRLNEEGHDVVVHVQEDDFGDACGGMVPQVIDWSLKVDNDTVVVADCTGNGDLLDLMRLHDVRVVGGCYLADRLEEDRAFANEVMEQCGLEVPLTKFFKDWQAAREYVEQVGQDGDSDEKLYFKPCGRLSGNMPSYGSNNTDELLEMLEYYQGKIYGAPEIAIQHGVDGIDISTEGWFDGQNFVPSAFNHTLETKHMLDGDTGPSGGCTGNVVWACADGCPLCAELLKVEDWLRENNYAPGPIDLNAVVGDEGVFALEFTPRFGYDATPTLVYELVDQGMFGEFLEELSKGSGGAELPLRSGFAAGVRLSIPPWPSTAEFKAESGLPVQGLTKSVWEHFCPMGIMLNEDGDEVTSTVGGILGVATGYADTVSEAFEHAYKIAKKITVPDKQTRTDLVEHFDKKYRKVSRLLMQLA